MDLVRGKGLRDENSATGVGHIRNAAENLLRGVQVDGIDDALAERFLRVKKDRREHLANGRLLADRSAENTVVA